MIVVAFESKASWLPFFQVLVAPPLYRARPYWYQKGLPQIASRFSLAMSADQPANMILLPSFVSQDLQPDGKHLTPVSGLHYVLFLFDQSEAAIALQRCSSEVKLATIQESVRHHDDRLSYLESRHLGLNDLVSIKAATDAEFKDWTINRSEEDWFTVMGLPRLGDMLPREWQKAARRQVNELIKIVLQANRVKLDYSILYVANPLRHRKTGGTVYNVKVSSNAASSRIRELFSGFFRGENPVSLPTHLRGVSVRNKVTLATRIRLRILRELGKLYVESNPGSSFKVRGFDPRPLLFITPARGSSDRPKTLNFIEAVTTLSASFSDENLAEIFAVVGTHHEGELRQLFVVITDDERARCLELVKSLTKTSRPSGGRSRPSVTAPSTATGSVFGLGSGVGLDARSIASLPPPPPPPPPPCSSPSLHRRPSDLPEHPHRGTKRGQTSDDQDSETDHGRKKKVRSRRSSSSSSSGRSDIKKGRRKSHRSRGSSTSSGSSSGNDRGKAKSKSKSKKSKSKRH